MRLLIAIALALVVLSAVNYAYYNQRRNEIIRQAASGALNANGVNEPATDLQALGQDQANLAQEHRNLVNREFVIAILAGAGLSCFISAKKFEALHSFA